MLHFSHALLIIRKMDYFKFVFESTFTILQPTIACLLASIHYVSKSSALILGVWETFKCGDQCGVQH